jgi:hypothetical protein
MVLHPLQEHLEGDAVMQVFARVDLVADVDAVLLGMVQDRRPALGELIESRLDEAGRTLRERVEERPDQRAGKCRMRLDAEMLGGGDRHLHLLDRPFLPRLRVAAHFRHRKPVEDFVIGRMHRNQLPLQMRGQFGNLDAIRLGDAGKLVAVILGSGSLFQVDQLACPGRNLHAEIPLVGRPFGDAVPGIERCGIPCKLPEKQAGALDRLHENTSVKLLL